MAIEEQEDLADAIRNRVIKEGIHTALPATVKAVSFDAERGLLVQVQPDIPRAFIADTGLDDIEAEGTEYVLPPTLTEVPVCFTGSGAYTHTVPIAAGTTGVLLVMESSIDEWLITNGPVQPEDPRRFALQDAVFLPMLRRFSPASQVEYDPSAAVMSGPVHKFGAASASRKLALAVETADELAALYDRLEAAYVSILASLASLPAPPPVAPVPWGLLLPLGLTPATPGDVEADNILVED